MSPFNKNRDLNREEKQNLREFSRLNKTELIEIIYKLEDLNLSIKSRNVELERMLEERGGLILSLNNSIETLKNALNRQFFNNGNTNTENIQQEKITNTTILQALSIIFINTLITFLIVRKLNKKKKNKKKEENNDIKKSLYSLLKKTHKAINKLIV